MIFANRASGILYWFLRSFSKGIYILPANVCPVVPLTFQKAGVEFEFSDVSPRTLCIDEATVIDRILSNPRKYSGMVFVRTYGFLSDMSDFFSHIKNLSPNFMIIDDRCLCFPDFSPLADDTDIELYSTGNVKIVDLGYGGYAKSCHDIMLENSIDFEPSSYKELERLYKLCLKERRPLEKYPGNWLDAGIDVINSYKYIKQIEESLKPIAEHKTQLNDYYFDHLPSEIALGKEYQNWRFNILVEKKEDVLEAIFANDLYASSHYASSSILFDKGAFPVTKQVSDRIINLFNDNNFTLEQAKAICSIICETLDLN